ncbi:hypothetical protein diail_2617 [Diaporthe ilicicola]|nr:hypothetical protein diail_2617 [Diaporthe ilicicola]
MSSRNQGNPSGASQGAQPTQTVAQRAAAGNITSITGLNEEEEDELLLYAIEQEKLRYQGAKDKYGWAVPIETLRARVMTVRARRNGLRRPPRVPVFTDLDNQLLLQAVRDLAKGPLDKKSSFAGVWKQVKPYIHARGGTTTAGRSTLKKQWVKLSRQNGNGQKDGWEWHSSDYGSVSDGEVKEEEMDAFAKYLNDGAEWHSSDYEPLSGGE